VAAHRPGGSCCRAGAERLPYFRVFHSEHDLLPRTVARPELDNSTSRAGHVDHQRNLLAPRSAIQHANATCHESMTRSLYPNLVIAKDRCTVLAGKNPSNCHKVQSTSRRKE
jgi:hypothetical protein